MSNTVKEQQIQPMLSLQSVTAFTIRPPIHSFTAQPSKTGLGDLLSDSDLILALGNAQTLQTTYDWSHSINDESTKVLKQLIHPKLQM